MLKQLVPGASNKRNEVMKGRTHVKRCRSFYRFFRNGHLSSGAEERSADMVVVNAFELYRISDPNHRGSLRLTPDQLKNIIGTGHRLGCWAGR